MKIGAWILLILLSLALAMILRYLVIEPSAMGLSCAEATPPFWCIPRQWVILIHVWNGWSLSALMALMFFVRYQTFCWLALGFAAACLGMVLYNTGMAALAFLLALYLLGRRHYESGK